VVNQLSRNIFINFVGLCLCVAFVIFAVVYLNPKHKTAFQEETLLDLKFAPSTEIENYLYFYKAHVTGVYDGDSITVTLELGLDLSRRNAKIRLARIDAPELRGETKAEGRKSRDALRELILDKQVYIQTLLDKRGKYGRLLGEVWVRFGDGDQIYCVNDRLLKLGLAKPFQPTGARHDKHKHSSMEPDSRETHSATLVFRFAQR
jgi:micrococcal nuclease